MLDAPFEVGSACCRVMKKKPAHKYNKETGLKPITAQMASESMLRTQKWLQDGCNAFDGDNPISNPMSFWTEQDVLLYIKEKNLPICSVYGDIVEDSGDEEINGQMSFADLGLFDKGSPCLKTTGCTRTGCVFCLFGCHLDESPNRLEMLKKTHPKLYEYVMKPEDEGGLGYKEKIDWINANSNGKVTIKY